MNFVQPIRDQEKIDEIKLILKKQNYRNYFLFVFGINTGLRIGDMLKLQVKDVRDKTHITLNEEKTEKVKRFKINSALQKEIVEFTFNMKDEDYLFASRSGKPISRVMAWKILNKAANKAQLNEIGTHTLRKTFGYHFYQRNKDVAILQKIFNHSSPSETLKYIGISQDIIDNAIDNFKL